VNRDRADEVRPEMAQLAVQNHVDVDKITDSLSADTENEGSSAACPMHFDTALKTDADAARRPRELASARDRHVNDRNGPRANREMDDHLTVERQDTGHERDRPPDAM